MEKNTEFGQDVKWKDGRREQWKDGRVEGSKDGGAEALEQNSMVVPEPGERSLAAVIDLEGCSPVQPREQNIASPVAGPKHLR